MKKILKKFLLASIIILSLCATINLTSSKPTQAAGSEGAEIGDCTYLLGMTSWYCGVKEDPQDEGELTANIVKIASNILADITVLSSYLVLGFVVYGGYLHMFSSGDPTKAANGRKVLLRAFIGLAIILFTNIILNAIRMALIGDKSFAEVQDVNADMLFINAINFAIGVSGLVCLIFIIIGAISYMTSAGDAPKLQKAKSTILYALIGLLVVGLAATITAFVSNMIRDAGDINTGYINQTIATKELHEK